MAIKKTTAEMWFKMCFAVLSAVILVMTDLTVTSADPVVPYKASSNGSQSTEQKLKHLEEVIESMLNKDAETTQELHKAKIAIEQLTKSVQSQAANGAVYIRWGRTVCEGDALILYEGYAAGSHYSLVGGGSNTLCLTDKPEWGTYDDAQQASDFLYGVEYELDSATGSPFSTRNNGGQTLRGQDAPCVMCHTALRQTQLMIPGKKSCPTGWVMEYWGYLVGGGHLDANHRRAEFVCLDEAPEPISGGSANQNGLRWYPVQSICGSLPCAPYVPNREVTCVVCTI